MLGLTFEKLFVLALVVGLVIGPRRLPEHARQLAEAMRSLRRMTETARRDAEREMEIRLTREEWEALDPRRYDPRRIVRETLAGPPTTPSRPAVAADPVQAARIAEQAARVRPGQTYLAVGSAAHPRRIRLDSLPADDPRRIAATAPPADADDARAVPLDTTESHRATRTEDQLTSGPPSSP